MSGVDIIVPSMGESVTEATVSRWLKQAGDAVKQDEALVELETDKVTLEVNATSAGVLSEILAPQGSTIAVGAILGRLGGNAAANGASAPAAAPAPAPAPVPAQASPAKASEPATPAVATPDKLADSGPAVRKLVADSGVNVAAVNGTGRDGRLLKEDVMAALQAKTPVSAPTPTAPRATDSREERVKMTKLRRVIAGRLKEAQNTAALLTTFNEIDMTALNEVRASYKEAFEKKHGVKLGFMSFFVKAAVAALQEFPAVNGEIDGEDIIYKHFYDIGVAVSTPSGLVVPVVRDADMLSLAQIEGKIAELGRKGRDGKLAVDELTGGSFTISNGGVFGSLMSTPIINPPQSAILGMHKVQDRPVAINGQVVIRPMMYMALTYDHRIVDGREAVSFLVRIKENLEDPRRLLLGV